MRFFFLLIASGIFWPVMACAMPLPDCAGTVAVASARVVRIERVAH